MSNKKRFTRSGALLPWLLLGVLAAPAFGQPSAQDQAQTFQPLVAPGWRIGGLFGTCFHTGATRESCPLFLVDLEWTPGGDPTAPSGSSKRLRFSGVGWGLPAPQYTGDHAEAAFALVGAHAAANTWPDPPDPDPIRAFSAKASAPAAPAQERRKAHHRGTTSVLAQLVLRIPVKPHFLVEPFLGAGVGYIWEGKAEAPDTYALESQWMPVISFGGGITYRLTPRLDVRFQVRSFVFFPDDLQYMGPVVEGVSTRVTTDLSTVATSSVLVGIGYRLGSGR